jgi:hypothetical protein
MSVYCVVKNVEVRNYFQLRLKKTRNPHIVHGNWKKMYIPSGNILFGKS